MRQKIADLLESLLDSLALGRYEIGFSILIALAAMVVMFIVFAAVLAS